jgi:hypothetical protein
VLPCRLPAASGHAGAGTVTPLLAAAAPLPAALAAVTLQLSVARWSAGWTVEDSWPAPSMAAPLRSQV